MKYIFAFIMLLTICISCKPKIITGKELNEKLIETMNNFLAKPKKPGITFTVKDVNYFPDVEKKSYVCQFHVNMHFNNRDTIGIMAAVIPNDFSKVDRTQ